MRALTDRAQWFASAGGGGEVVWLAADVAPAAQGRGPRGRLAHGGAIWLYATAGLASLCGRPDFHAAVEHLLGSGADGWAWSEPPAPR